MDDELEAALAEIGISTYRLDEITHGRKLIFVYGPTGAGKTHNAYLLNQTYPNQVGFIDYERGKTSIEGSGIRNLDIHDPDKFSRALALIAKYKVEDKSSLNYIYLDSAAEFFEDLLEEYTAEAHKKNPTKEDADVPSQRSYLKTRNRTRRLMKWLKDAPFHMVFTSQDADDTDSSGVRKIVPSLSPSIITTYFRAVDAIIYLHKAMNGQYAMLMHPVSNIHAKSRTPIGRAPFPPVIYGSNFSPDSPSIADVFRYYDGEEVQWITEPKKS